MTDISKNAELQQSCITAVKSRFFAQYYGQEILKVSDFDGKFMKWHILGENLDNIKDYECILLKHISTISEDECIFIGTEILDIPTGLINYEHKVSYVKNVIINQLNKNITKIGKVDVVYSNFYLLDYLRKQGYAVPFLNYSVQNLINLGWVQLI